jgi:hypothetical protein
MVALQQLSANLLPGKGTGRIGVVSLHAPLKFLPLRIRQLDSFRAFDGDAVPDVFDELDALGYGQLAKIPDCVAHVGIIFLSQVSGERYA